MDFLATVTTDLYARYGDNISELCLVFPNKRAHLFFSQHLSHIIQKPLWQPAYKSIEELIADASPWRVADAFSLLVELYTVYREERKTDESFDHFYPWGETLLNDFDQIDKYRVNVPALFTNLRERKAMDGDYTFLTPEQLAHIRKFWSHFSEEKESKLAAGFIALWDALPAIYQQFRKRLADRSMAYEGMLYREVADAIATGRAGGLFPQRYVFIGFNALNECEKALFHFLQTQRQADFYWDYDAYYLNDPTQEAGTFLRYNVKQFPSPVFDPDYSPFREQKKITIIAAPSPVAQAKVIPQLLAGTPAGAAERTVIVLADKQLLIPVLHVLPAISENVNISMGYPLRQTSVYSLIELLMQLFTHGKPSGEQPSYYYRDILTLIAHPYIQPLIKRESLHNRLIRCHNIYIPRSFFMDEPVLHHLLAPVAHFREASERLLFLMDNLYNNERLNRIEPLLEGYIGHIVCRINQLTDALQKSSLEISIKLYGNILRSFFRQDAIPFTGEPLAGIQLLGLFETMGIDFDNVVILSANEGTLPGVSPAGSFIPYNLRRGFGLPLQEHQEAASAYYFYRLLQRAKNIHLVYSTKTDGLRTGEASRYLLQLKLESSHRIEEQTMRFPLSIIQKHDMTVPKESTDTLDTLSPSGLNTYLDCPLRFYFRYIARLKEPDEMTGHMDARLFGSLLHKAMELIYQPSVGIEVTGSRIDTWLNHPEFIPHTVKQAIAAGFYHTDRLPEEFHRNGDLLLTYDILCQYINQLLIIDRKQSPFVPEGLEVNASQPFSFTANGQPRQIQIGGIIDRLHRKDHSLYVVDYKTGRADNAFDSIEALFGADRTKRHDGILQTLIYSAIVQHSRRQPVTPLLYFLRESHVDTADFSIWDKSADAPITDVAQYSEAIHHLLSATLSELFDASVPFSPTADKTACTHCPYQTICHIG